MNRDVSALQFRLGRPEDVDDLVRVHQRAFPGYALALAGPRVLKMFYTHVLNDPDVIVSVVEHVETGRAVGCTLGTSDSRSFWSKFYGRYRLQVGLELAWRVWVTPAMWPEVLRRLVGAIKGRIGVGVKAKYSDEDRQKWPPDRPEKIETRLLSVGIDPDMQGKGLSKPLWMHWFQQLHERGVKWTQGTVFATNKSAIAAYAKFGLVVEQITPNLVSFTGRVSDFVSSDQQSPGADSPRSRSGDLARRHRLLTDIRYDLTECARRITLCIVRSAALRA